VVSACCLLQKAQNICITQRPIDEAVGLSDANQRPQPSVRAGLSIPNAYGGAFATCVQFVNDSAARRLRLTCRQMRIYCPSSSPAGATTAASPHRRVEPVRPKPSRLFKLGPELAASCTLGNDPSEKYKRRSGLMVCLPSRADHKNASQGLCP
jgi:hypothetical protein